MFWGANYIVVRELNFLLKEENVSLTQVLEADDILQECKADNKALIQFLTKPEVLAELITLITEEPPSSVELASQYRHANIACEVLTSHLSTLSDRLSMDSAQMNRLCDFLNKDPPLNPLLASYFSRTVEMLLERSPKQDWYLYHIVCLRVLDFFKSRRDFLPNLLRHMATSAVADIFKYFIRLDDLFNKIIMEWLEEHQFLESMVQIICGTYTPEGHSHQSQAGDDPHHTDVARRWEAVASANAAALLVDLVLHGCAPEGCSTRARTAWVLVSRLQAEGGVRGVLQGMFTAPPAARRAALVHGCQLLLALLAHDPILLGEAAAERTAVELGVAPHLPLLHQALLHHPPHAGVGLARVQVAALLAHLALSEVHEVPTTLLTLGTPAVLVDMFFQYKDNNFLHAQVCALLRHALANRAYRTQYARHLLVECDLLTRLMDTFEENEEKTGGAARSAHMGHVVLALARLARALDAEPDLAPLLPPALLRRWDAFLQHTLRPRLIHHDTPLGGYYPSDNVYEFNDMSATATLDDIGEDINADDIQEIGVGGTAETSDFIAEGLGLDDGEKMAAAKNNFLELASQRFDDDMWDDTPEADLQLEHDALAAASPWECAGEAGSSGEGWAQFGPAFPPPVDPFAPSPAPAPAPTPPAAPALPTDDFTPLWTYDTSPDTDLCEHMRGLRLGGAGAGAEAEAGGVGAGGAGAGAGAGLDARALQLANAVLSAMTPRDLATLHDDAQRHHAHNDVKVTALHDPEVSNNNFLHLDANANAEICPLACTSDTHTDNQAIEQADDTPGDHDTPNVKDSPDTDTSHLEDTSSVQETSNVKDISDDKNISDVNDTPVVKDISDVKVTYNVKETSDVNETSNIKEISDVKDTSDVKDSSTLNNPEVNATLKVNDTCEVDDTTKDKVVSDVENSSQVAVHPDSLGEEDVREAPGAEAATEDPAEVSER